MVKALWPTVLLLTIVVGARSQTPKNGDVASKVQDLIKDNKVMIFSKSYCPYCKNSKSVFDKMKVAYYADELDLLPDGKEMQEELKKMTGQSTVPNIFIGGVHVGGNDSLMHAKEKGKLEKMFAEIGITDAEL
mmetsp:Transcript_27645/g.23236  ORF Transcript_27645/g.23236 Transcript_27645/m.23236 type:complete len:133 (+) Transcript_27645:17-415(+)|eukprot:CAMPEP_0179485296 /NCGR_PEP_ID=MMETSP0799-20121207/61955_1 /TAXON_ID=46947 /ORGANISM="Geminigera cryophila, Strain CCMP2564" /LENGTH=132 /DNA_ID=CAMNT_0021299623 /DNA_START=8 /DNA_END=406 /DNA_ORIENTATION=+